MKRIKILITLLVALLFIINCEDSTSPEKATDPAEGLALIGEKTVQNTEVRVYSDKGLEVGYNKIYIKVTDSITDKLVEEANVSISTLMDMGQMKHASPYENPAGSTAEEGLFPCAATFIMSGMWELHVNVHNLDNNDVVEFQFDVEIAAAGNTKKVTGTDSMTYFITLVQPAAAKVGLNDFELTVNYQKNMMSFPAVEDVIVKIEPSMPSMGHGSPNNVDPAHQQHGHYMGKVNFTMTGDWRIDLNFFRGDSLMHTSYDINVQ